MNSGTLTVRAVEGSDPTSDIVENAPTASVQTGTAVAVEPAGGTEYTLNGTGVPLPQDAKPSLLFDSIIEDSAESTARTDVLVDGKSVGAVSTYTFEKVNANHTISASFEKGLVVADPDDTGVSSWLNTKDHAQYLDGHAADLRQSSDLSKTHWAYYDIMEATNAHDYTKADGAETWTALHQ